MKLEQKKRDVVLAYQPLALRDRDADPERLGIRLRISSLFVSTFLFVGAFVAIPWRQLGNLRLMPGDIGDARLNNYFLEQFFLWFTGQAESFWNMDFFFPFPLVGGFSDNHFGSALFYVAPRLFGIQPDTSFQLWFLVGYLLNFASAHVTLRKLGLGPAGAAVGGVIFAFALPTSAHAGHAQLHHRWALPFAVLAILRFIEGRDLKWLGVSFLWIVLQFYIGIYSGFFSLLLVSSVLLVGLVLGHTRFQPASRRGNVESVGARMDVNKSFRTFVASMAAGIVGLGVLFFPYFEVSRIYQGSRSWGEISSMLPRLVSYFIADHSTLWAPLSLNFSDIPMRHEHQMFVGLIPLALLFLGVIVAFRARHLPVLAALGGGLLLVALSFFFNGLSLWFFIHELPLVSAIRAVTRLDQTLLFVTAYGAALAVDRLLSLRFKRFRTQLMAGVLIGILVVAEAATGTIGVSEKTEWRNRVENLMASVPAGLPDGAILFFSQKQPPWYAAELDAMWASLLAGQPTLNGYSGQFPPGWASEFGEDCLELPLRIRAHQVWAIERRSVTSEYQDLYSRVIPIGFESCQSSWSRRSPVEIRVAPHSAKEISQLRLSVTDHSRVHSQLLITVEIENTGPNTIVVRSLGPDSLRLSWAQPPSLEFSSRVLLNEDIRPGEAIQQVIAIPLSELDASERINFSILQEAVFWGHDVGVEMAVLEEW